MKQEQTIMIHSANALANILFQQKSIARPLIVIGSAAAYYVANLCPMRPVALENDIIPAGGGDGDGRGGHVADVSAGAVGRRVADAPRDRKPALRAAAV